MESISDFSFRGKKVSFIHNAQNCTLQNGRPSIDRRIYCSIALTNEDECKSRYRFIYQGDYNANEWSIFERLDDGSQWMISTKDVPVHLQPTQFEERVLEFTGEAPIVLNNVFSMANKQFKLVLNTIIDEPNLTLIANNSSRYVLQEVGVKVADKVIVNLPYYYIDSLEIHLNNPDAAKTITASMQLLNPVS